MSAYCFWRWASQTTWFVNNLLKVTIYASTILSQRMVPFFVHLFSLLENCSENSCGSRWTQWPPDLSKKVLKLLCWGGRALPQGIVDCITRIGFVTDWRFETDFVWGSCSPHDMSMITDPQSYWERASFFLRSCNVSDTAVILFCQPSWRLWQCSSDPQKSYHKHSTYDCGQCKKLFFKLHSSSSLELTKRTIMPFLYCSNIFWTTQVSVSWANLIWTGHMECSTSSLQKDRWRIICT